MTVARGKKTLLVLGANALIGDVVDAVTRSGGFDRIETAGLDRDSPLAPAHALDLLARGSARRFAEILAEVAPTLIVDLWRSETATHPARVGRYDAAAGQAAVEGLRLWRSRGGKPCRVVVLSSTAVYGVGESSPILRIEADALEPLAQRRGDAHARWVDELRDRETHYAGLEAENGWRVLCLRAAAVVGGPIRSEILDYVSAVLPVRIAGFDPPMQVLHYTDLLDALARGVTEDAEGTLNVVGRGVVLLSRLVALSGRVALPLPEPLARWLAPSALGAEALKWRCVADGRRAAQVLGFHARFSAEDALAA
jgi:nucleoside-diphosphate-sugar epimerase